MRERLFGFSVAHFAFLFLAGMSMFPSVVSQQEFPAGCGSPADVQVGALAGLETAGFGQALYKNHTLS